MKTKTLRWDEVEPCVACGGGLAGRQGRSLHFYRVTVEPGFIDPGAVQRLAGLTMMLGGHERLASVFSPDQGPAEILPGETMLLCSDCGLALDPVSVARLMEMAAARKAKKG